MTLIIALLLRIATHHLQGSQFESRAQRKGGKTQCSSRGRTKARDALRMVLVEAVALRAEFIINSPRSARLSTWRGAKQKGGTSRCRPHENRTETLCLLAFLDDVHGLVAADGLEVEEQQKVNRGHRGRNE